MAFSKSFVIGGIFFALGWTATVIYFIYSLGIAIDGTLHNAPTFCTVLSSRLDSDDGWEVLVTYPVPGHSPNYNSWLDNANDATYTVNQTIPCFYSTHHPEYAVENPQGISGGTIFGMAIVCLFSLPIFFAIGAGMDIFSYTSSGMVIGKMPSNMTDTIVRYMLIPVNFCKMGFETCVSWAKSIKWSKKNNTQAKNTYDLEDQKSQASRTSSGTSYRSTKKLLSSMKHHDARPDDQNTFDNQPL